MDDVATWSDQDPIPSRVAGTALTVTSDGSGDVTPSLAWALPLVPGKYDIVVDTDGDVVYDAGTDALDDSDIDVAPGGFLVIPEYALGTSMQNSRIYLDIDKVFAWTLVAIIISFIFERIIRISEKYIVRWK